MPTPIGIRLADVMHLPTGVIRHQCTLGCVEVVPLFRLWAIPAGCLGQRERSSPDVVITWRLVDVFAKRSLSTLYSA